MARNDLNACGLGKADKGRIIMMIMRKKIDMVELLEKLSKEDIQKKAIMIAVQGSF